MATLNENLNNATFSQDFVSFMPGHGNYRNPKDLTKLKAGQKVYCTKNRRKSYTIIKFLKYRKNDRCLCNNDPHSLIENCYVVLKDDSYCISKKKFRIKVIELANNKSSPQYATLNHQTYGKLIEWANE